MTAVAKAMSYVEKASDTIGTALQLPQKATQFLASFAELTNKKPRQIAIAEPLTEKTVTDLVAYISITNYLPKKRGVSTTIKHTGCIVEYAAIEEIACKLETSFETIKRSCESESNTDMPCEILALSNSLHNTIRALHNPKALKAFIDYEQLLSQVERLKGSENILENEIQQHLEHIIHIIENNIIKVRVVGNDTIITQSDVWARGIMASSIAASSTRARTSPNVNAVEGYVPPAEGHETEYPEDEGERKKRVYNSVSVLYCALRYGGASTAEEINRSASFAAVLRSLKASCDSAGYSIQDDVGCLRALDKVLDEALVGDIALDTYTDAQKILTRYLQDARTKTDTIELHVPSLSGDRGNALLENIASIIFQKVVELDNSQWNGSENGTKQKSALIKSQHLPELAVLLKKIGEHIDSSNTEIKRLMSLSASMLTSYATDGSPLLALILRMLRCFSSILKQASPTVFTNFNDVAQEIARVNYVVTKTLQQQRGPRVINGMICDRNTGSRKQEKKIKTVTDTEVWVRNLLNKITSMHCLTNEVCYLLRNEPLLTVILQELKKDTELVCHTELLHVSKLDETALAQVFYGISKKVALLLSQDITEGASNKLRQIHEISKSTEDDLRGICAAQYVEGNDASITYVLDQLVSLDKALTPQTCAKSVDIRLFHVRVLVEGCIANLAAGDTENHINLVLSTLTRALGLLSNIRGTKHVVYPSLRHCIETVHEILESRKQQKSGGIAAEQFNDTFALPERHHVNIDVAIANTLLNSISSDDNNNDVSLIPESVTTGYETHEFAIWVSRLSELGSEALLDMSSLPTMVHSYPFGYASSARPSLLGLCPSNWQILERTSGLLSLFTLLMEDISRCEDRDIAAEKRRVLYEGIDGLRIARSSSFTRHSNYVLMLISTIIGSTNKIYSYGEINDGTKKTEESTLREEEGLSQLNNYTVDDVDFQLVTATNMQEARLFPEESSETVAAACCNPLENNNADADTIGLNSAETRMIAGEKTDYLMLDLKVRPESSISPGLGYLITDLRNFLESTATQAKERSTVYKTKEDEVAFLADIESALVAAGNLNSVYVAIGRCERPNAESLHKMPGVDSFLESTTPEDEEKIEPTTEEIKQKLVHEAERAFSSISHAKMVGPIQNSKVTSTFLNSAATIAIKIMSEVGQLAPRTKTRELFNAIECTKRFVNILEAALNGMALCEEGRSAGRYASIATMSKCVAEARARLEYLNLNDLISEYSVAPSVRDLLLSCLNSLYDFQHRSNPDSETGYVSDINTEAAIMSCRAICYLLSNHVTQSNCGVSDTEAVCASERIVHGLSRSEICAVLTYEAALKAHEVSDENSDHNLESLKNHLNDTMEMCVLERSYFLSPLTVTNKLQEAYKLCVEILKNLDEKERSFISLQKVAVSVSRALSLLGTPCEDMHSSLVASGKPADIPFFPGEKVEQKNSEQELRSSIEDDAGMHKQSHPESKVFSIINYIVRKVLGWLGIKTKGQEEYKQEVVDRVNSIQKRLSDLQQCITEHTGRPTSNAHILKIAFDACKRSATLATQAVNSKNLTDTLDACCHLIGSGIIVQKASKVLIGKRTDLAVDRLHALYEEINGLKNSLRKSGVGKSPALHTLNNPSYSAFGGMVHATDSFIAYEVLSAAMWFSANPVGELKNTIKKMRHCYPSGTMLRVSPNIFPVLFTPHESFETLDVICKNCVVNDNDSGELQAVLNVFAQNIVHYSTRRAQLEAKFPTSFWRQLTCSTCKTPDLLILLIKNSCIKKEIRDIRKHLVPCDLDKILQSLCEVSDSTEAIDFLLNRCYGGMLSKEVLLQISNSSHINDQIKSLIEDFINRETYDHALRKDALVVSTDGYPDLFSGKHYVQKTIQYKEERKKNLWHKISDLCSGKRRRSRCLSESLYTNTSQSQIELDKDGNMSLRGRPLRVITEREEGTSRPSHHNMDAEYPPLHQRTQAYASGDKRCRVSLTGCVGQSARGTNPREYNTPPVISVTHTDTKQDNASEVTVSNHRFLHDVSVEKSHNSNKQL